MSFLSSIGKFFKKLLDVIMKILKWLLPILIIVLIIIAIFFPYLIPVIMAWAQAAWAAVAGWAAAAWKVIAAAGSFIWTTATEWVAEASTADVFKLAMGAAVVLNPEGVSEAVGNLVESAGELVTSVFGPYVPLIIGGVVAYFVFFRKSKRDRVDINVTDPGGRNGST